MKMLNRMFLTLGALVFVATLGLAAPVLATPVTLYVDDNPANVFGDGAFGWEPGDVANGMAAGLTEQPIGNLFTDDAGTRFSVIALNNPITPDSNPASPSKMNPVMAKALFEITALDQSYMDLSIVIIGKSPTDPTGNFYAPGNVGISADSADGWGLVRPDAAGMPDLYYLTLSLGDLMQGQARQIEVEYRVAQSLLLVDPGPPQTFELPQLWVGYMEEVPEAGGLLWMFPVIVSVIAMRRASGQV